MTETGRLAETLPAMTWQFCFRVDFPLHLSADLDYQTAGPQQGQSVSLQYHAMAGTNNLSTP